MSPIFDQSEAKRLSHTNSHRINILSGPALRAAPAKISRRTTGAKGYNFKQYRTVS